MTTGPQRALRRPRAAIVSLAVIGGTGIGISAGLSGCGSLAPGLLDGGRISTVGAVDFETPLAIPPLAESTTDDAGIRHFDLTASASSARFRPGVETPTYGYDGPYLGPTLVADVGERIRVTVHNELRETTTFHLHGMHLPAKMDGGPHQPIEPGEQWAPEWTVHQQAATLWYHPHPHGETEHQVAMGLAGMVILRDDVESALELPREYGVDDVPMIVQDAALDGENRGFVGSLGDTIIVNGTVGPYRDVTTEAVRLRLLNASTARTYNFGFSDSRPFHQIASDGGLLAESIETDRVQLSPGERAEIVVRFTAGETVVLRSNPPDLGTDGGDERDTTGARNGGADSFDVLELRAASVLSPSADVPKQLAPVERLDEQDATVERELRLDGFVINQEPMDLSRIDQVVEAGSTEIWTVKNGMELPHNFHVHDVQFQVLSIGGSSPPPELSGWKDTVYLRPQTEYRLIMHFTATEPFSYTDPESPYMYHCHLLWHEDQGMMGQFVVVAPGQGAGTIQGDNHEH